MTDTTANEILEWSMGRPLWQRDALRRLFETGTVSSGEIDDLTELCKAAHGLASPKSAVTLEKEHLRISDTQTNAVSLLSVKHLEGVNALAPDQTVSFGARLTVVYGQNAAGKSGNTRIPKKACRSWSTEEILGDVIAGGRPMRAQATIRYTDGTSEFSHPWRLDVTSPSALTAVSVF
jgi:hypothetical protein